MNVTTHLRYLLSDALGGVLDLSNESAIQYAEVDFDGPDTRVFFVRVSEEHPTDLSGEAAPRTTRYAVECLARSPAVTDELSDAVRTLHDHHGEAVGIKVWAVEVSDRADSSYRGVKGEDEPVHVADLDVTVIWEPGVVLPPDGQG